MMMMMRRFVKRVLNSPQMFGTLTSDGWVRWLVTLRTAKKGLRQVSTL